MTKHSLLSGLFHRSVYTSTLSEFVPAILAPNHSPSTSTMLWGHSNGYTGLGLAQYIEILVNRSIYNR